MKVPFFSRAAVGAVWAAGIVVLSFITADILTLVIGTAAGVWFQFYLAGQRLEFTRDKLIRHSGRLFRRRTILLINNICWVHTVSFHSGLPGIMKIVYPGDNVHLIGFTGRQLMAIERVILNAR